MTELQADTSQKRSYAEAYERFVVPALFAGWAASLVEMVSPARDAHVLDVGCGTGVVTRAAHKYLGTAGRVSAVDNDRAMLQVAKEAADGLGAPIQWLEGDAARLPFGDSQFDIVYCQQALQFLADPLATLTEIRRVLRPGGRIALNTWRGVRDRGASQVLGGVLARHLGPDAARELNAPCGFGNPEALGMLLSESGFTLLYSGVLVETLRVASAESLLDLASLITSLGPWLKDLTADARRRLVSDLDNTLNDSASGRLAIPVEASVAIAQR